MYESAESMRRVDVLERCAGMNAARAGRMLALLPELGKVSTPHALRLSGLSAAHDGGGIAPSLKKSLPVRRLLLECMKEVLQDRESPLAGFLRHLAGKNPAGSVRTCLAATLRFYSDTLRHPNAAMSLKSRMGGTGAEATAGKACPDAGDTGLPAAGEEPAGK